MIKRRMAPDNQSGELYAVTQQQKQFNLTGPFALLSKATHFREDIECQRNGSWTPRVLEPLKSLSERVARKWK